MEPIFSQSIASLTPAVESTSFLGLFDQLMEELAAKNLGHIKIEFYFGDEWFCPDESTAIAIPFWLTSRQLQDIETSIIGYAEGGTKDEFFKLLRHEAGHCIEHAFKLSKKKSWQAIFGNPKVKYDPDSVPTIKSHPDYVENLSDGYAQTHPEEDFAETFAVWLDPLSNWRGRYSSQPTALGKLLFVDDLMVKCSQLKPSKVKNVKIFNARRMRRTLGAFYEQRAYEHVKRVARCDS